MSGIGRSTEDEDEYLTAEVTEVNESSAIAWTDSYGHVFVPVYAFQSSEIEDLCKYITTDNQLLLTIDSEEIDCNGCQWTARSAVKFISSASSSKLSGYGTITYVSKMECHLFCKLLGEELRCSLLTYSGGDKGKNSVDLSDVVCVGDKAMFITDVRDNQIVVTKWYPFLTNENITENDVVIKKKKNHLCESSTQTNVFIERTVVDIITQKYPNILDGLHEVQEMLLDASTHMG